MKLFDSKRDREIIDQGGFFCLGCLVGKPADDRSREDQNYCQSCYDLLNADKQDQQPRDYWTAHDCLFVTSGRQYGVTRDGLTVSIPLPGVPPETGTASDQDAPESAETGLNVVAKIENGAAKVLIFATSKTKRGRPRKNSEDVSRWTAWRREKEAAVQGQLF